MSSLLDRIWPKRCAADGCDNIVDRPGRQLCSACFNSIAFNDRDSCCACCALPIATRERHRFVCDDCRRDPPPYKWVRSAAVAEGVVRELIHALKYRFNQLIVADLVDLLQGALAAEPDFQNIDVILPVPLSFWSRTSRGFNQSALLADELGRRIDRRCAHGVLGRTWCWRNISASRQSRSNREQRLKNAQGLFQVRHAEYVRGRSVLLVDDVMTSGATLAECARVLLAAGAREVCCAVVARAAPHA